MDIETCDGKVIFLDRSETAQYYLVETNNNEQLIGLVEEETLFSSKFLRIGLISRDGSRIECHKYFPFNSIASIIPMGKKEAIALFNNTNPFQNPFNPSLDSDNQLPPFNFELDFELKKKWRSDKKVMVAKLGISLVSLVVVFVLVAKSPILKEVAFGCGIATIALLLSVTVDLIRSEVY